MANNITAVALVQASPVFNNLSASVEKAVALFREATKIVALGECWLAGYPAWLDICSSVALWNHEPTKNIFASMRQNSLIIGGSETAIISESARENKVTVVIGANERVESGIGNGTLYNALLTFDETGTLVNHHRKLIPTYTERLVHGQATATVLNAVATQIGHVGDSFAGNTRCRSHVKRCTIPANKSTSPFIRRFTKFTKIASRQYAFEGRCFVLAVGLIMAASDLPNELLIPIYADANLLVLRGGSCLIAPDGSFIIKPFFDCESILAAEIDLSQIDREKMTLDVSGHY